MLLAIARNSFLILRRDKIFVPVVVVLTFCSLIATIASEWSLSNLFHTTIYLNTFSFHLLGTAIGIFWGVKSIGSCIDDGSIEVELAGPCPKEIWALGRFLGLVGVILSISLLFLAVGTLFLAGSGNLEFVTSAQALAFLGQVLTVLVIASLAFMLSTFVNQGLALFATFSLWIAGMLSPMVLLAVQTNINDLFTIILEKFVVVWNLQRLNFVEAALNTKSPLVLNDVLFNFVYGMCLLGFFLTVTALRIRKMELTR